MHDDRAGTHVSALAVPAYTFGAVADARVESGAPSTNRGDSPYLRAETTGATGTVWSYVRFDVSGLSETVQSARLRVFVSDGTDDGPKVYGAASSWSESTITWNTKPALGSVIGDDPLKVPSGGYVEWDVTSLVGGNGAVTFAFVPDSSDRWNGRSKEDSNPPQLVIHTAPSKHVFAVEADARVNSEYPTVEYGTVDYLWVRPADPVNGYPDVRTFLRFTVSGVTSPITNARVRLFNYEWASNGPRIYHVPDNTWGEATINWSNMPARASALLEDEGPLPSGAYAEWDVSAVVTGDGTYSFVLEGDPTSHSMRAWAKEHGTLQPQLVVLAGGTSPPPPSPTGARWPLSNSTAPDADRLGDAYGPRLNSGAHDFHAGIDIPAPIGTAVHAVLPGTVSSVVSTWDDAANPCCGGGRKVVINHGGSPARYTTYLHLDETLVTVGATVAAGDVIGRVGISGAQHAHLHLTYSVGGAGESYSRNPLEILPHTQPGAPSVTFGSSLVSIVLPVQQMTVKSIKLEGGGQSRTVDYYAIVARGNPARDEHVQGDGMYMEADNPSGTPLTFALRVRPDPLGAFVPTKITLDAFDGRRWELTAPAASPLSDVITRAQFEQLFPSAGMWGYDSFLAAAASHPELAGFGATGDLTMRRREVAAFLANVAHETGLLTTLVEQNPGTYCASRPYGCPSPDGYHGRGPLQLSWNYNYYNAGVFLGVGSAYLDAPAQVGTTPSIGWRTSLWFWMKEKGASWESAYPMTSHDAMTSSATPPGFLATINAINGGLECNKPAGSVGNEQRASRIEYYEQFVVTLLTSTGAMNTAYCP